MNQIQQDIVEEFAFFEDWTEKYEYIIESGKAIPKMDEKYLVEENKVRGCQSHVWLYGELVGDKIHFQAESEALIVKGLVSFLLRIYNDKTPDEILSTEPTFIDDLGLSTHLSPTRSNGLESMVKKIKAYAIAYRSKLKA